MKHPRIVERFIYALAVVLSLAAVWLVLNAPADFLNIHSVYQGF
jgi:hypothetical protein